MSKHRSSTEAERLQRVLRLLKDARSRGVTTFEIQTSAQVTDVKDILYELRCNGVEVTSEWERTDADRQGRVRRFKRHWLTRYLKPQRTLPLEFGSVMEAV